MKVVKKPEDKVEFAALVAEFWENSKFAKPIGWMLGTVMYGPHIEMSDKVVLSIEPAFFPHDENDQVLHFSMPHYGVNWDKQEGKEPSTGALAAIMIALEENNCDINYEDGQSESFYELTESDVERALEILAPYTEDGISHLQHGNIKALYDILDAIRAGMLDEENFGTTYGYGLQIIHSDEAVKSTTAAMAKFAVISNYKVAIRTDEKAQPALDINLNGAFGACVNKAWCGGEPISLDYLRINEGYLKATRSYPKIERIDKFPVYLEEVIPQVDNIRILAEHSVRFGALVGSGSVFMPRGSYANFGAGTIGGGMIEGSISSGVLIGDGTDVGGAASTQGILSTGKEASENIRTTVGKNSLLGAMSGLGIPLGDGCILDAGVTILPGTKVTITAEELQKIKEVNPEFELEGEIVNALKLSMLNGLHFRQDSTNGKINVRRSTREIVLNADLH